jgi:2-desacetyl-2-hydroxyethyl bacteriochlorophyllide A dehydrogenase
MLTGLEPAKGVPLKSPAIVFTKPNQTEVQSVDMPDPGEGEVQVRTLYSTISPGTEGWLLQDLFTWQKTLYPGVPGYQRVGVITKLGKGVTGWRAGDKVFATVGCWQGPVPPMWGAHLALGNTRASEIYRIPEGVSDVDAASAIVAQVGYNAAYRPTLQPGDWVVVYGDGIIGQSASQAARSRQAKVILVGHRNERLALAKKFSADHVISNREQPVSDTAKALTGGEPVKIVLDSVQNEAAQKEYEGLLPHGSGQIVYCGFTPGTGWANMAALQMRELTTHFISGWNRGRTESTLDLLAQGRMNMKGLITHQVPYQRGPEMYDMILRKSEPFMGITLDWTEAL